MCCSTSGVPFPEVVSQVDSLLSNNAAEHCNLFLTGGTSLGVLQGEMEPGRIGLQACNISEILTLLVKYS